MWGLSARRWASCSCSALACHFDITSRLILPNARAEQQCDEPRSGHLPSCACALGSSGLSRGGAQRYTQLIGCESALRRLDHFAESLSADIKRLARGIHLLSNFSDPFRAVLFFSSFRSGVRSSKEYSRYRKLRSSNINYVRTKQVNRPESFKPVQPFRAGETHCVSFIMRHQRTQPTESQRGKLAKL